MTGPNGHAQDTGASTSAALPTAAPTATPSQFSEEKVKALVAGLRFSPGPRAGWPTGSFQVRLACWGTQLHMGG